METDKFADVHVHIWTLVTANKASLPGDVSWTFIEQNVYPQALCAPQCTRSGCHVVIMAVLFMPFSQSAYRKFNMGVVYRVCALEKNCDGKTARMVDNKVRWRVEKNYMSYSSKDNIVYWKVSVSSHFSPSLYFFAWAKYIRACARKSFFSILYHVLSNKSTLVWQCVNLIKFFFIMDVKFWKITYKTYREPFVFLSFLIYNTLEYGIHEILRMINIELVFVSMFTIFFLLAFIFNVWQSWVSYQFLSPFFRLIQGYLFSLFLWISVLIPFLFLE